MGGTSGARGQPGDVKKPSLKGGPRTEPSGGKGLHTFWLAVARICCRGEGEPRCVRVRDEAARREIVYFISSISFLRAAGARGERDR